MSEQEDALAPNTILDNRYRILSERDSQDLGITYWAYDLEQDHRVSLLVLAHRWGRGREALERLQQLQHDFQKLGAPGLARMNDMGLVGEQIYLVREPSQDPTLADLLAQRGRLEISLAVWIAIRVCEALAPVHRAGLVHGGLSPHSILVARSQRSDPSPGPAVSLLDAGLLPAVSATRNRPWGRFPYLSPEQAAGAQVHPPSDVYVIGSLLYEMLAGRPPFRSSDDAVLTLQHLRQQPPSLEVLVPDLPPLLDQIVRTTMAKEPAARYRNAGQLAQILRSQVAAKLPAPLHSEPAAPSVHPPAETQERLVVPPPPAHALASTWSSGDLYQLEQQDEWLDESASEGTDWMMVALFVAALLAVLGLIPLWRAVYRRYTAPPPILAPGASYHFDWAATMQPPVIPLAADETQEAAELGAWHLVWYNPATGDCSLSPSESQGSTRQPTYQRATKSLSFGSPAYGFPRQDVVHCPGKV